MEILKNKKLLNVNKEILKNKAIQTLTGVRGKIGDLEQEKFSDPVKSKFSMGFGER